jgi:hypothetical protein
MTITCDAGGVSVRRSSSRLKGKAGAMPMAKLAEKLLCRRLGIVNEGDHITEEAIKKFAELFHGRLPKIAVDAFRALFRLDCDLASAVEDALLAHGGGGALDPSLSSVVGGSGAGA